MPNSREEIERAAHDILVKTASDAGLVLELGWLSCAIMMKPAPEFRNDMRIAYYAGAQHLFASMMTMLDPDADPTPRDLVRMDKMYKELAAMEPELKLRGVVAKGRA
jgi:hypothetical protein